MALKVGEFFISLAVDAASGNLSVNELVGALGKLDVVSVGTVGVLSKITSTLWGMAKAATGTAVEMSALSEIAGVNPKMVQQWEKAAQRIGIQSGSIVSAVKGVNDMMGSIAARKSSPPAELTGWLGITPQKGLDAQGRPIMKNFFDLFSEIAKPNNRYWSFTPGVQQQLLGGAFPGADSKEMFRLLNEARAGKLHPERISVLENGQVKDLTAVSRKNTEIGQQMTGIFDKLLVSGGNLAAALDGISEKLKWIDDWMGSKNGQSSIGIVGKEIRGVGRNISKYGMFGGLGMAEDSVQFLAKEFGMKPVRTPMQPVLAGLDDLRGRLTVTIFGENGKQLGNKEVFLGRKVSNADVEQITINAGNGGLGQ